MARPIRRARSKTDSAGCSRAEGDRLIAEYVPLARVIAARFVNKRPSVLRSLAVDLRSAAFEGLVGAARNFDPARGVPFRSYADLRIKGACVDFLRSLDHVARDARTRMEAAGEEPPPAPWSLDADPDTTEAIADPLALDPLAAVIARQRAGWVAQAVRRLKPRLRKALLIRYGQDITLVELGRRMGYSEPRAYQVMREAREAIRADLAARGHFPGD